MNRRNKVIWSERASKDLEQIIGYAALDSLSRASAIFQSIRKSASSLYSSPERGRIVPELQGQGIRQYRELIVSPWRLIYRVTATNVYVFAVVDSRQNVEDILLHRLAQGEI